MKTKDMIRSIEEHMGDLITSAELLEFGVIRDGSSLLSIRIRRKNRIPFFKFGSSYRYLKRDVIDFIESNTSLEDEYTGTFFISKDKNKKLVGDSKKEDREARILQKVDFLFEEFSYILNNKVDSNSENNDEWSVALLNFSGRMLTDSIKVIYEEHHRIAVFDGFVPRLRDLLEEKA